MFFKYKKYEYIPGSSSKQSKLEILTEKYETVFLKILNKEELSCEDAEIYLKGFDDIKSYVVTSLVMNMQKKDYDGKSPIEKKLYTLYKQYMYLYSDYQDFLFRIREELDEICATSIYSAIGLGGKAFNKSEENSNLILFINNSFFFNVLNFLDKKVNSLKYSKEEAKEELGNIDKNEEAMLKELEVETLLKEKNIKESIGEDMYVQIKEALISEEVPSHLEEVIKYIMQK